MTESIYWISNNSDLEKELIDMYNKTSTFKYNNMPKLNKIHHDDHDELHPEYKL